MKLRESVLCITFIFWGLCVFGQNAEVKIHKMITTQWQEDLRYLQNTVHKDYSFLFVKTTKEIFDAEVETLYKNIPNLEGHEIIVV